MIGHDTNLGLGTRNERILFLLAFSVEVATAAASLVVKTMSIKAVVDEILYKDSSTVNNVRSVHKVCTQNLELF